MAIGSKSQSKIKPIKATNPVVAPPSTKQEEEQESGTFFGEHFWKGQATTSKIQGSGVTLHDEARHVQVASIIADVLDEVRFEYRMSCIKRGYINPGELAMPMTFKAKALVDWIQAYYDKYHRKDTPDCFFPGTEDPKITPTFIYYYRSGYFASSILLGKLLAKGHDICGIELSSTAGNSKQWILNPPPRTLGEEEIAVEQDLDQEEIVSEEADEADLGDES